jgi:hypothetical protein
MLTMREIEATREYTTKELATLLGTTDGNIRRLKSEHAEEMTEGVHWRKEGVETIWTEAGLEFMAKLLSRSSERAIAVYEEVQLRKQEREELRAREEHYSNPRLRYADLPEIMGQQIANSLISPDFVRRIDRAVIATVGRALTSSTSFLAEDTNTVFRLLDRECPPPIDPDSVLGDTDDSRCF